MLVLTGLALAVGVRDVFQVVAETPQHTYQLLTKRARRFRRAYT
ncbi:DUF5131 family protein [Streptomyces sp. NPDC048352]